MNYVSTLPINLCIKLSGHKGGGYEVWSLEDIRIRTKFGPYKGRFVNRSERCQSRGFQWKVETKEKTTMILDGSEEKESNWLRYVNYASNKEEQNLIAVQCHSEVYFITCKTIPANSQLFVWYEEYLEKRNNQREEMSAGHSLLKTKNMTYCSATEKSKQGKETDQHSETSLPSVQPTIQLMIVNYVVLPVSQHNKLDITNAVTTTEPANTLIIGGRPYKCKVCHKSYSQKRCLREHERDHTGERPFQCKICKKDFKRGSTLRAHKLVHSTERPHKCDICQMSYKYNEALKLHKLKHSGERPFECKMCNKRFFLPSYLRKHIWIHTGEMPYECDICHKKFQLPEKLRVHRQRVHSSEKP